MGGKSPKAPDYKGAAQQQAQASRGVTEQQTWANRADQFTPFGNQTWENQEVYDPATGQMLNRWAQNTALSPEAQRQFDAQMRVGTARSELAESMTGRLQNDYGAPIDLSGVQRGGGAIDGGAIQSGLDTRGVQEIQRGPIQGQLSANGLPEINPSQRYYDQAGDALYNRWASRALPAQAQEDEKLRTRLINQGLNPGDEAYDSELTKLRQSQGDAQQQAGFQATAASGQEASRMFGMDSGARAQLFGERETQGNFGNQAQGQDFSQQFGVRGQQYGERETEMNAANRAQNQDFGQQVDAGNYESQQRQGQIAEILQQRGFSLNEINAILSGQQVQMPDMPSYNTASRAEGTQDLAAAQMQNAADTNQYSANQGGLQGWLSGGSSIARGFMGV